jgi:hypothetical protein
MSRITPNWWDDQIHLHRHQLSSRTEYLRDQVVFQYAMHSGPECNEYKLYNMNVDCDDLELGHIQLEHVVRHCQEQIRAAPDYRHPGPTQAQLRQYPALALAWREFRTIHRLTVGDEE